MKQKKLDIPYTEDKFQKQIIDLAELYDWLWFHVPKNAYFASKYMIKAGFPDLTLVKDGRLILAEIKSAKGRLSDKQRLWGNRLNECEGVEYYVWRPANWNEIEKLLK